MVKKLAIAVFLLILGVMSSYFVSTDKYMVIYDYTIDGDTICLIENGAKHNYRLLYVDTPEYTKEIEPFGKEAAELTQSLLENASSIQIEYQTDNETEDKYQRKLVWVFVDGKLLQEELAKAGLVEDVYDNGGNYKYKLRIMKAMMEALVEQKGIYSKK